MFSGENVVEQARKELIERQLHAARKIVRDALQQAQTQNLNPAAVAQVLGENAVMLMIHNFGPDAGRQYTKSLTDEAARMADFYATQQTGPKPD